MFGTDWENLLRYLESHPLANSIPPEAFSQYVRVGIALGDAVGARAARHFIGMDCRAVLEKEGVPVKSIENVPPASGVQILAEYRKEPPGVVLYPSRLQQVHHQLPPSVKEYFGDHLLDIALAHELYHYLWDAHYDTGNWAALMGFLNLSPLMFENVGAEKIFRSPVTQEIAALQFAKSFLGLSRSPVVLCLECK